MKPAQWHYHRYVNDDLYGQELEAGDEICEGDLFPVLHGWFPSQRYGSLVDNKDVMRIRPVSEPFTETIGVARITEVLTPDERDAIFSAAGTYVAQVYMGHARYTPHLLKALLKLASGVTPPEGIQVLTKFDDDCRRLDEERHGVSS